MGGPEIKEEKKKENKQEIQGALADPGPQTEPHTRTQNKVKCKGGHA